MPAAIAHLLHAKKVSLKIPEIVLDKHCFYWGSQGGDFFFADRFSLLTTLPAFGNRIHSEKVYPCFEKMLAVCREERNPYLLSYCLGYICHYALDSEAHPFVNAWVNRYRKDSASPVGESIVHRRLEADIDAALFKRLTCRPVTEFSAYRYFTTEDRRLSSVAGLWSAVADQVYGQPTSQERIRQAMLWFRRVLILDGNPDGRRQRQLERVESVLRIGPQISSMVSNPGFCGYDCLNLSHREWESRATGKSSADFPQLFVRGVNRGISLCRQFLTAVKGEGNLEARSFSLGFDSGCSTLARAADSAQQ